MAYSDVIKAFEKRREAIIHLRSLGWTLQKIADKYGISPQRVKQIVKKHG